MGSWWGSSLYHLWFLLQSRSPFSLTLLYGCFLLPASALEVIESIPSVRWSVQVCETYVVNHLMGTGLCCAPLTYIVHLRPTLCTMMVHKGDLCSWELRVSPRGLPLENFDILLFKCSVLKHSFNQNLGAIMAKSLCVQASTMSQQGDGHFTPLLPH